MKAPPVLNLFKDISGGSEVSGQRADLIASTGNLFHKLLEKEVAEVKGPAGQQAGTKNRADSSEKEGKLIASLASLPGLNAVVPSTKSTTLAIILKRLGLTKEQIVSVLGKATDSRGQIHLDMLARHVEAILRSGSSKGSKMAMGREYVPLLALAFLRLGADVESVKDVLEKYASGKSELQLTDVNGMIHNLAPGLELSKGDIKTLLRALGIPVRPEDIASLMKESKGSGEVKQILDQPKSRQPDLLLKRKLAQLLRDRGMPPDKVKEVLENTSFETIRAGLGDDKGGKLTEGQIESLLQSIRLDDRPGKKHSLLSRQLIKDGLKGLGKKTDGKTHAPLVQKKPGAVSVSNSEKPEGLLKKVGSQNIKDNIKDDLAFLRAAGKVKHPSISIHSHLDGVSGGALKLEPPVSGSWVDPRETVQKVMRHLRLMLVTGQHESRLSLHPPELGHIDLKVLVKHGHLQVQLGAEHPWAKEIVEGNLSVLRHQLAQAGFVVDKLDVTVGLGAGGFAPHSEQQDQPRKFFSSRSMPLSSVARPVQQSVTPGVLIRHDHQLSIVV